MFLSLFWPRTRLDFFFLWEVCLPDEVLPDVFVAVSVLAEALCADEGAFFVAFLSAVVESCATTVAAKAHASNTAQVAANPSRQVVVTTLIRSKPSCQSSFKQQNARLVPALSSSSILKYSASSGRAN